MARQRSRVRQAFFDSASPKTQRVNQAPHPGHPQACWVDTPQALAAVLDAVAGTPLLAVDTEFERSVTYLPRPALIQLATVDGTWLLDPLALDDLSSLGERLSAATPLKVMHAAMEDLEVLSLATGHEPEPLFDTQLAAAFAGLGVGLGYHTLVHSLLGREVRKDQTRSNWLRRPLSRAQLDYAAADVEHLVDMHAALHQRLASLGRLAWLQEETELARARAREDSAERDFLRLVNRVADDDAVRGSLDALCRWRDREARRRNRPRRHLLDDPLLLALARQPPADRPALESLEPWASHKGRLTAEDLMAAVQQARTAAPRPLPALARDLSPHRRTMGAMRGVVNGVARSLDLDPALLAPRRLLEKALVQVLVCEASRLPEEFRGWRAPRLEEPLMECLHHA